VQSLGCFLWSDSQQKKVAHASAEADHFSFGCAKGCLRLQLACPDDGDTSQGDDTASARASRLRVRVELSVEESTEIGVGAGVQSEVLRRLDDHALVSRTEKVSSNMLDRLKYAENGALLGTDESLEHVGWHESDAELDLEVEQVHRPV